MRLRSLSLCSGVGGIDLGLARWCRTVCYVERDSFAASVLVARMEDEALDRAPVWDDLKTFDGTAWRGAVDLVTAGWPCQPFSTAGARRGVDDPRHLWPHVARILKECGAPLLFGENVRGHLSLGFSDVLRDLADLGFDAEWECLRASDVGAPQRRERLFVLAYAAGGRSRGTGSGGAAPDDRVDVAYAQGGNGRLLLQQRGPHEAGAEPRGSGEAVADAGCLGSAGWRGPGDVAGAPSSREGDGAERQRDGDSADDGRADVGDADSTRWTQAGSGHRIDAGSEPESGRDPLGHPDLPRLEGRGLHGRGRTHERPAWPPGPEDRDGWRRYGGPQPVLRGGAARLPDRVDRLRCLGNAVVPAQAALAFSTLTRRITSRSPSP